MTETVLDIAAMNAAPAPTDATEAAEAPPAVIEFASVGLTKLRELPLAGSDAYMVLYQATNPRPEPGAIKPCLAKG